MFYSGAAVCPSPLRQVASKAWRRREARDGDSIPWRKRMLNLRKKILVAIDGSPLSDKAAEEAVRMAAGNPSQFKSKVYGLLVLPNAPRNTFTDFVPAKPITEQAEWAELKERIFYVIEKI